MPETQQKALPAPVLWAQRSNCVYVRIAVEDAPKPEIKVENNKIYYKGTAGATKQEYVADFQLFGDIKPEDSKFVVRDRGTEFVLMKANEGPYWKRLLKDEGRNPHWLKIDFNKWKDEDDSDNEGGEGGGAPGGGDFEEMMRQMGGLGGMGGGMPGMGGMGGMPDLGDLDDKEDGGPDSDDEELPELEEK